MRWAVHVVVVFFCKEKTGYKVRISDWSSDVCSSDLSPQAQRKLYLISYGCQMNDYDSAEMADVLAASHGYARTQNPDEADLLLLNTCSVREKAQEKVFSELGR